MFTEFFLKKRIFTFVVMLLLFGLGAWSMTRLRVETVPEVNTPVIYAAIPLPGGAKTRSRKSVILTASCPRPGRMCP